MPRKFSPYGPRYEQAKRVLLAGNPLCWFGCGRRATTPDHDPPLSRHFHVEGSGCCVLRPACATCQSRQGADLTNEMHRRLDELDNDPVDTIPEPVGFGIDDAVWDVAWLDDLRDLSAEAVWPRLMTVPHPRATGSLGREFESWVLARTGRRLRWLQRLVVTRLLEVDADGRLVWDSMLLTMARQLGKSWLLRELIMWRLHQGERFGEPQLIVHTGMTLNVCKDVMRPEAAWCKLRPDDYGVREVNSQEEIEWRFDGSRWVLVAKDTPYGKSASMVVLDEAWKVKAAALDDGLEPTLVATEQSQLLIVSTAHRLSTTLLLDRRAQALAQLGDPVDSDLIIEWSAPRDADIFDREAWRLASPFWSARRERMIAKKVTRALAGFASEDPDEPDPIESVRAQWLNIHPIKLAVDVSVGEPLVDMGQWRTLRRPQEATTGRMWVAVEDDFGREACVAAVADLGDGLFEVDAWLSENRTTALVEARALIDAHPFPASLIIGASFTDEPHADRAGAAETRFGLPLLRTLATAGQLVHDDTPELDEQLGAVRVREVAGGLALVSGMRSDVVRAVAWALRASVVRRPEPAIH